MASQTEENSAFAEETVPFLAQETPPTIQTPAPDQPRSRFEITNAHEEGKRTSKIKRRLYVSHFLSTWNSRVFEFAAVLFLAHIFEGTLLPTSVYALCRAASAIVFAPMVGRYVDREDRLKVVRVSIVRGRVAVILSCTVYLVTGVVMWASSGSLMPTTLGILIPLACVEKLCSIMNLVAIERDWVVVIAENSQCGLDVLNSQMRRIDLVCKLVGPLAIALIDGYAMHVAIEVIVVMNILSVCFEYFAIADIYRMIPALASRRIASTEDNSELNSTNSQMGTVQSIKYLLSTQIYTIYDALSMYYHHPAFLPSMSLSLLYLTVLSFSGQMVTYLVAIGFTPTSIGLLRAAAMIFEISATFLAPVLMNKVGPLRAGLWSVSWQLVCTLGVASIFWTFRSSAFVPPLGLVIGVILSRIGLWSFDLCLQIIIQEAVESDSRGSFSSLEVSFQNFFELCSYASTIILARPDQFRYPVLLSAVAVLTAYILYASFVRQNRGHLIHWSKCLEGKGKQVQERRRERRAVRLQELP